MIGFDEALAIIERAARPLGQESIMLATAHRRILAAPLTAMMNAPPADISAMDGYAVREADAAQGGVLRVIGTSFAGAGANLSLSHGECMRIFTGAPLPHGADRIVIQENVQRQRECIRIEAPVSPARHVRRRGSDFEAGVELLPAGRMLDPRALVAAAAADVAELQVWRQPRLTILGTGDELAEPGHARSCPGAIPESLSFGVGALAEVWGAEVLGRRRLADEPESMRASAADAMAASDLVVMTGGASVGEKDFAKSVFESLGVELLFSKVAIKPGKPVWLGRREDRLVIGLPGNPTSAMVTARLLLAPLLAGLGGRSPDEALRWQSEPLAAPVAACGERETFVRGRWQGKAVLPLVNQDSGAQRALAQADVLIRRRPNDPAIDTGASAEIIDF